jgi:hypothetical protein
MAQVRALFSSMVGGALLGILLVSLLGPRYIQWDATSGGVNALCHCAETARSGADRIIALQMTGCAAGAVAGALGGALFLVLRRKRGVAQGASAAAPGKAP